MENRYLVIPFLKTNQPTDKRLPIVRITIGQTFPSRAPTEQKIDALWRELQLAASTSVDVFLPKPILSRKLGIHSPEP